ncbi:MAG TPA: hypothetical protein DCQ92_17325 [Verrucomicrobia subdivision 3 bacterium]|nr:hypothetical protein [Limisphaerales bacterium]
MNSVSSSRRQVTVPLILTRFPRGPCGTNCKSCSMRRAGWPKGLAGAGTSIIKSSARGNGFSYTSARMKTENLYTPTYGRFEWRAKLPAGVGMWPALWMMGTNIPAVGWPACGEIDVVETRGQRRPPSKAASILEATKEALILLPAETRQPISTTTCWSGNPIPSASRLTVTSMKHKPVGGLRSAEPPIQPLSTRLSSFL